MIIKVIIKTLKVVYVQVFLQEKKSNKINSVNKISAINCLENRKLCID